MVELTEKTMSKNVLIVDDSAFMRRMLRDILENIGYNIVGEAPDGKEAVELYKKLNPDIVTMDIIHTGKTGIDIVKKIKKIDNNARIVMITAMGHEQLVAEAISAGASDFIVKPFKKEDIIETIKKLEV